MVGWEHAAIDYYAAVLPLIAGAVSDATLFAAYRETNTANETGPQVAVQQMTDYLAGPDALPGSRADRIDQVLTTLLR